MEQQQLAPLPAEPKLPSWNSSQDVQSRTDEVTVGTRPNSTTVATEPVLPQSAAPEEPAEWTPINARELSAEAWRNVFENNDLLCGFLFREQCQDVIRARLNAFEIKGRGRDKKPTYQVVDGSSIRVQETSSAIQMSLAENAFSSRLIETHAGLGGDMIQLGASGTRGRESSHSNEQAVAARMKQYYGLYNFPRARVIIDEEELVLSQTCMDCLDDIRREPSVGRIARFHKLFGHIFVTSALLGGQQKTVKVASALESKDDQQNRDALRGALGARIAAPFVNVGFSYSKDRGSGTSDIEDRYRSLSYLGMNATGGDTLISPDVQEWTRSIASYQNWRVIENETSTKLIDLAGLVASNHPGHEEYSNYSSLFKFIERRADNRLGGPRLTKDEVQDILIGLTRWSG